MKKAFDQTFRDIKRGVNKTVLKVPSIEQKVLDATSNEPWGPHGTHLADIAQASRNYHEYQMIMSVVWKRLNDTGKNWRHVYKALTVLEYLVANGSERVIDDIREHAYQISTLSTFQYIDSVGRDQGSNVRKKSQSLVALVNDKERIQEVREKAAANRDKFRNSPGGMNRPYDDDRYEGRYGSRDEDRNGYGREREWGDDRNGRHGDSYGRDGGRYGEDHYGRDDYRDDESRGRSRSVDGDYGPRSRSSDRDKERAFEDDGHHSSRGSNAKAEDGSLDGSRLEPKLSGQNLGAPPSYEDVVGEGRSPVHTKRDGETATAFASKPSSPQINTNHQETVVPSNSAAPTPPTPAVTSNKENEGFDLFDPRGTSPAAPPASGGTEMDLLGSLSDSFSSNSMALVPSTSVTSEVHAPTNSNPGQTFVAASPASGASSQPFDDPFGDGPFRAVPSTDGYLAQPQTSPFAVSGEPPHSVAPTSGSANNLGFSDTFDQNIDILADILPPPGPSQTVFQAQPDQLSTPTAFPSQTGQPSPQTGYAPHASQPSSQTGFPAQPNQTTLQSSFQGQFGQPTLQPSFPTQGGPPMPQHGFQPQGGQSMLPPGFPPQGGQSMPPPAFPLQGGHQSVSQPGFPPQGGHQSVSQLGFPPQGGHPSVSQPGFLAQGGQSMPQAGFPAQSDQSISQHGYAPQDVQNASLGGFSSQLGTVSQAGFPSSNGHPARPNNFYGGFQPQGSSAPAPAPPLSQVTAPQYNASNFYQQPQLQSSSSMASSQPSLTVSTGALAIVPQQPAKEKFETKSTVWADTLNRGLVNLNISGSKTNPLSDIGIDFEAINRKEKRMEKPSKTPVTSNVTMGKAMGSGSGIGRAGVGALRATPNPMVGSGMGITMGAPGAGPGFGAGYGGVNQPMGMHNMPQNMGIGMNTGQGFSMQQPPAGFPPGSAMPGNYNPMLGRGAGYGQQPYGGYR